MHLQLHGHSTPAHKHQGLTWSEMGSVSVCGPDAASSLILNVRSTDSLTVSARFSTSGENISSSSQSQLVLSASLRTAYNPTRAKSQPVRKYSARKKHCRDYCMSRRVLKFTLISCCCGAAGFRWVIDNDNTRAGHESLGRFHKNFSIPFPNLFPSIHVAYNQNATWTSPMFHSTATNGSSAPPSTIHQNMQEKARAADFTTHPQPLFRPVWGCGLDKIQDCLHIMDLKKVRLEFRHYAERNLRE